MVAYRCLPTGQRKDLLPGLQPVDPGSRHQPAPGHLSDFISPTRYSLAPPCPTAASCLRRRQAPCFVPGSYLRHLSSGSSGHLLMTRAGWEGRGCLPRPLRCPSPPPALAHLQAGPVSMQGKGRSPASPGWPPKKRRTYRCPSPSPSPAVLRMHPLSGPAPQSTSKGGKARLFQNCKIKTCTDVWKEVGAYLGPLGDH